jgi:hypothetical protein
MNKSKFILFLASIMLTTIFTLSCSGEDGKDGTSCTLDGNILTCGDKTLVIENGVGCSLEQDAMGKGPAIITCGSNPPLIIPMCNGEIYSLAKNVCDNNGILYGIVTIGTQTWMKEDLKGGANNKFTWVQATAAGACPNGWRLPSKADFDALVGASDFAGKWADNGKWWGEERSETQAYYLDIDGGEASVYQNGDKTGFSLSVRCIKD